MKCPRNRTLGRHDEATNIEPNFVLVPIVIATIATERSQRLRALEAGADEFLEKPLDQAIMLARVRTLLRLKRDEDALFASNARLARLQSLQLDLAACIVHDLRSPMMAVSANLDFVLTDDAYVSDGTREALADAASSMRDLRAMVNDLLVIARLEQPDIQLRRGRVDLADLAKAVAEKHSRAALDRRIQLTVRATNPIPLSGDASPLGLAIDGATIAVCNSGERIPELAREGIFDKFGRVDASLNARGNVGLGLSFCKYAVNAHGGTIRVEEIADWPVAFVVDLRVCAEDRPRRTPSRRQLRAARG